MVLGRHGPRGHLGMAVHNFQYLYEDVPQRGDSRQGWRGFRFCTGSPPERFSFFVGMHSVRPSVRFPALP